MTDHQRTIAALIAKGCSNKQIAMRLGISPRTVGNTLTLIYRTTGTKGRAHLAARHSSKAAQGDEKRS
jgi:DNA-binding CsgD family transcriptional regulator